MKVTRIKDAKPYAAAKHFNMVPLRLQGFEVTDSKNFWVGLSHFLPGGGAERDGTPLEKVYIVTSGEVTVITDSGTQTLGPLDSVYLAPGEARAVENRSNLPASMLVVMPYPPKA
jgi:quercetin dioxygenase-like cupin family protein